MGNRPVPTALKRLRGNPGKRPIKDSEPQYDVVLAAPPKGLHPLAAELWRQMMPQLTASRVLTEGDLAAFQVMCEVGAKWKYAVEKSWEGMLYCPAGYAIDEAGNKVPKGPLRVNPYVRIADEAGRQFKAMLVEFGMTPASRTKVEVARDPDEGNEFLDLDR
jgi:P27 family predicted phage terminase small subunit